MVRSIIICQPNDSTLSHMGELSAETLAFRNIRGYIVDGGCRDSDFIQKIAFAVFCRYYTLNTIRPLDLNQKTAGKVYTVRGHVDPSLDAHQTLLAWTALLAKAPPDSIIIWINY